MIRACIDCGRECYGRRCARCHQATRTRRAYRARVVLEDEPDPRVIPAPLNPIVVPPWVDCPELEFGFDVPGVSDG